MKKAVRSTLILFFASIIVNNLHRVFANEQMITPFVLEKEISISVAWYAKHICDLLSFSLLMVCVCSILKPVEKHLRDAKWVGHNSMFIFVRVWHRIFFIVVVVSVLDLIHYFISFRQTDWYFLIQNGFFFIMTSYYLYKAYRK